MPADLPTPLRRDQTRASEESADPRFTLDDALLAKHKAGNARRLYTRQIPALRAGGFIILCAIAWLHDGALLADPWLPGKLWLMSYRRQNSAPKISRPLRPFAGKHQVPDLCGIFVCMALRFDR